MKSSSLLTTSAHYPVGSPPMIKRSVRVGSDSAISAICLYVRFTLGSGRHPLRLFLLKRATRRHCAGRPNAAAEFSRELALRRGSGDGFDCDCVRHHTV